MAVGPPAATVISYGFPESLIMSGNPLPQFNDFNASGLVSLASQSLSFNSYGSDSCCWDLYGASTAFGSTLFNNFPNPSMQQSGMIADSAFLYPSDDAVDQLFLLGNDSDFLQQIYAGSTTSSSTSMISSAAATPVMHPNLVSTLKNMVTPGSLGSSPSSTAYHPSSCSATRYMNSSVSQLPSFFDQQSDFQIAATTAFLRGGLHSQNPVDSNHNILLQSSVYPGENFDEMCTRASLLSTAADEQITTHIPTAFDAFDVDYGLNFEVAIGGAGADDALDAGNHGRDGDAEGRGCFNSTTSSVGCGSSFSSRVDRRQQSWPDLERIDPARIFASTSKEEEDVTKQQLLQRPEKMKKDAEEILKCSLEDLRHVPSLRLDYEDVLNAWSDRGALWTDAKLNPQTPDVDSVRETGEDGSLWTNEPTGPRKARVLRYKEKRRTRLFSKKIRYHVRKLNAERRPRMKGRFVKRMHLSSRRQGRRLSTSW
ncbi:unnamed protein product [Sphagnum troendelagicum]|uniref:CCT domain-containing protein n=1 Tax=Sphagnum troendelagicum TaxID=128251 RepID=A0ABP0TQB5_9BRYO